MKSAKNALTGMILAAGVIVFGGFFLLSGLLKGYHPTETADIAYSMPRPKNVLYNFLFGLEGREIERTLIDPFKAKQAALDAKKAAAAKEAKKLEATKKAIAKAAATPTSTAAKRPQVQINVVGDDAHKGLQDSDPMGKNNNGLQNGGGAQAAVGAAGAAGDTTNDGKLSPAQWRALLQGQPTAANVAKLIAAFDSKDVDSATLYLIMGDMLQSSNKDTQTLGLTLAADIPSAQSFSGVVDNYDKLDKTVQPQADAYLQSYSQASKINILSAVLRSTDNQVVLKAEQIFLAGIQSGSKTTTGTTGSTTTTTISSASINYSKYIPVFQQLEKSSDSSIASEAQTILTQIQNYAEL